MIRFMKVYIKYVCGPVPNFIKKYIQSPEMKRLDGISYFCGMDYNQSGYYNFVWPVSRLDHSISTATMTYKLTKDKKATIAALFHDIATPCFSHVIDYYNKDFVKQESTEAKTAEIIINSQSIVDSLQIDEIDIKEVICAKQYPIVDNERPRLCVDRLDGNFITNIIWLRKTYLLEVEELIKGMKAINNDDGELEIVLGSYEKAKKVQELESYINEATHEKGDYLAMTLMANVIERLIDLNIINYDDLFLISESALIHVIENNMNNDLELKKLWLEFHELNTDNKEINVITKNKIIEPLYFENKQVKRLMLK